MCSWPLELPAACVAAALAQGLDEVNFPATGTTAADQSSLSVKVVDDAGELLGGLSGWTWVAVRHRDALGP
ncbi:hypothetical protein ACIHCV_28090 [Streptomyces sp. NPDC051956]|uniref:hypothetical protein n=1 Tax=Streptomyces sp. NPDC051956 TaxID=3365677 RepID=UPI0037D2647D